MQALFEQLQHNLQLIYRKGIDADKALQQLKQAGQGKHQAIFTEEAGFDVSSTQFSPYIEEVAAKVAALQQADKSSLESQLPQLVKQMELLLKTLQQFKQSLKKA